MELQEAVSTLINVVTYRVAQNMGDEKEIEAIKLVEQNFNSLQQLKAEIAALVTEMERDSGMQTRIDWLGVISRLRKLSAV